MILLFAALLAQQTPLAGQPPVVVTGNQVKQNKPKLICHMTEVTGSRFRQRVCQDENGNVEPILGVSNMGGGKLRETHENGASGQDMGSVSPH